jgi:hypothetical protein
VGGAAAAVSIYLQGTLPWLFDPESAELVTLARDADARTPATPCDPDALEADAALFTRLLRERHFGVATGRVALPDAPLPRAATWGELGALRDELRAGLVDEHVRIFGAPRPSVANDGPAVERDVVAGVLVLRVRRLVGTPDDERLLAAWAANADEDFAHSRIIVDLRGNSGGNDGHTHTWVSRRLRRVDAYCTSAGWCVRGKPLGYWNAVAWRVALYGPEGASPSLLAERHDPQPGDELELDVETYDLPAGDLPWSGRMLVLVDRRSRSSGESSAWLLRRGLGARLLGEPTFGMIEYGNIVQYALPRSGLVISLPTKSNDFGFSVESVGFPVDVPLDPTTPVEDVARDFDSFV